jgi:hypothetical protein
VLPDLGALPPEVQQQIQQLEQQCQQQLAELDQTVTVEKVGALLKDQKLRPFVLDIETDSTIQPDEMREKQKRQEFAAAIAEVLNNGVQAMQLAPQLGKFVAESLRFVASGFRPGRQMDEAIDEVAEEFANYQPPPQDSGEDPEAAKMMAQAEMVKAQATGEAAQAKAEEAKGKVGLMQQEMQIKQQETAIEGQKTQAEIQKIGAEIQKIRAEIGFKAQEAQVDEQMARTDMAVKARGDQRADQDAQHGRSLQEREFRRSGEQQKSADKRAGAESAAKVQSMKRKPDGR